MIYWLCLAGAILLEIAGTTSMKLSQGFTRTLPSVLLFVFYALSFTLMTVAVKRIDMSVSYAIWSGVGTTLIALIGVLWFREPLTTIQIVSIALIILGVVGLRAGATA
ncbi:MAG TPA: multidrug efflux SMR transporter [Casimicrobiaceae bacterium]|nr:multidrug efflux SMR transporter [Casimicrobiaceae bacterium]